MSSRFQPKFLSHPSATRLPAIHPVVRPWLTLSGLILALMLWNWVLTLSGAIAFAVGVTVYLAQERRLNLKWFHQSRVWKHHRSLWVALLAGMGGFGAACGMIHIWQEAPLPWVATLVLLQVSGTLAVLSILIWDKTQRSGQAVQSPRENPVAKTPARPFQDLLNDLTHANAVTRLIAVRQIAGWGLLRTPAPTGSGLDDAVVWSAADIQQCLQLMRKHESELAVQQAIDEAIARLRPNRPPAPTIHQRSYPPQLSSSPAFPIPNLMRTRADRRATPKTVAERPSVLYVSPKS